MLLSFYDMVSVISVRVNSDILNLNEIRYFNTKGNKAFLIS